MNLDLFLSLFASESCLHHIGKLAHGVVSLGQQVAFWWSVYSQMQSKKMKYSPKLFNVREIITDSFCDATVVQTHTNQFDLLFYRNFGKQPPSSLRYACRYKCGLILYHSLSYRRKGKCASHIVCIELKWKSINSRQVYGEIIFFFSVENQPFCLFKQYKRSRNMFSSLIEPTKNIPKWSTYIDKYYSVVCSNDWNLKIYPCSTIVCKCILVPLDDTFSVSSPLELEIEHD
jgi:hypothetical protein